MCRFKEIIKGWKFFGNVSRNYNKVYIFKDIVSDFIFVLWLIVILSLLVFKIRVDLGGVS